MRSPLRYSADVLPVAIVVATTALGLGPFLGHWPLAAVAVAWCLTVYGRTFCAFSQHNHAHLPVFRVGLLNRFYDALLAQNTAYPTALWELHHNRGHHRNFLEPDRDVARVTYPGTRTVMPRFEYAFRGNLTIYRDAIRIGREEGRAGKPTLLPKLAFEVALQLLVLGGLLVWNAPLAVAFFVAPPLLTAFLVWWESYPHHLGVPLTNVYDASMTVEAAGYNRVTFNIGHHTAHHEKPTLHWSLLPGRTAVIRDRIHAACFRREHATVAQRLLASQRQEPLA
jgi:fatty acid desaturase